MKSAFRSPETERFVPTIKLTRLADGWILDGQYRRLSDKTIKTRRVEMDKLLWWLGQNGHERCGTDELKAFLTYIATGHNSAEGRWGNKSLRRPVRPRTVKDYHTNLKTFFRWLVDEGYIEGSPMEGIRPPVARADQTQPFTQEQVSAIAAAAKQANHPLPERVPSTGAED